MGVALVLVGCRAATWAPLDLESLPDKTSHPDADAVVLSERHTLEYFEAEDGVRQRSTKYWRVAVLDPAGSEHANLVSGYDRSFVTVDRVRGQLVRPDGEVETFTMKDVGDHPAFGGSILYADSRVLTKSFDGLPAGTVVDWEVTLVERDPTWRIDRHYFGWSIPVKASRFEVSVPTGWDIEHRVTKQWAPHDMAPEVVNAAAAQRYVWTTTDLSAVETEASGPSFLDIIPVVTVRLSKWTEKGEPKAAFGSYEEYARWMFELQGGTAVPSDGIRAIVDEVLADAPADPRVRAAKLYDWVRDNVRYVAVEVGVGGWRPHEAHDVFAKRYGDCKDKANLLRTMLELAGIESHLAELYSHDGVPRPFVLPNAGHSNHAILAVHLDGETILADPTTRTVPFGSLPVSDQGADVLVLHPDAPRIIRTPRAPPADNHKKLKIVLTPEANGIGAAGDVDLTVRGAFGWSLRGELLRAADGEEKGIFSGWIWLDDAKASKVTFDTKADGEVRGSGHVKIARIGTRAGDRLVFKPAEILRTPGRRLADDERTQPVVFARGILRETELRVKLDGYTAGELPKETKIESEFGTFVQTWALESDGLVVRSHFERPAQVVPPTKYDELRSFFRAVVQARGEGVVLRGEKTK